jgi:hypothetical protein
MKRTVFALATMFVVFVAVFAVLALRPGLKVKAHRGCSDRTLKGNYGLVGIGEYGSNGGFAPSSHNTSFSMIATFDGQGAFSGSEFNTVDNGAPYGAFTFTGSSYSVNPDCSCTLTIPSDSYNPFTVAVPLNGIIVDAGGDEVKGTWYDATDEKSGAFDAKRVAEGE